MAEVELHTANLGTMEMPSARNIQIALAKAVTHHLAGQSENALSDLDIAIENGSRTAELFAARGYLQLELGRFEKAWQSYSKALELESGDPNMSFNAGIASCRAIKTAWYGGK